MPLADLEGNSLSNYQTPVFTSAPAATPNAGAAGNPTNSILSSPGETSGGSGKSTQDWYNDYLSSPEKKASDEASNTFAELANMKASLDKTWEQKDYELAKSMIAGSGGSYGAGLSQMEEADRLQKEKAAHDLANQQEYVREALGSRGLGSSGQAPLEQGELKYSYEMLIKQIDLAAAARRAQAAQAGANAQRSIRNQLANLEADHAKYLAYQPYEDKLLIAKIADVRNGNESAAIAQFKKVNFDPATGRYYGDDGTSISVSEAQQSVATWQAADPANAASYDLYSTAANKNMGW